MYTKILAQGTKFGPEPQVWTTMHYMIVKLGMILIIMNDRSFELSENSVYIRVHVYCSRK